MLDYNPGDIIARNDYHDITSCWIRPDGKMIYVDSCCHYDVALMYGYEYCGKMEQAGYVHVSGWSGCKNPFTFIPKKPSKQQVDTILEYCSAAGIAVPKTLTAYLSQSIDCRVENIYLIGKTRQFIDSYFGSLWSLSSALIGD